MDRESYSIDDILSEVKRRRAEEENKNSNNEPVFDDRAKEEAINSAIKKGREQAEKKADAEVEPETEKEPEKIEQKVEPKQETAHGRGLIDKGLEEDLGLVFDDFDETNEENEIAEETEETKIVEEENEIAVETDEVVDKAEETQAVDEAVFENEVVEETEETAEETTEEIEAFDEAQENDDDGAVDLMSYAEETQAEDEVADEEIADAPIKEEEKEPEQPVFENVLSFEASDAYSRAHSDEQEDNVRDRKRKEKKDKAEKKKAKKRFLRNVLLIILVMTLGAAIFGGLYIQNALDRVSDSETQQEDAWSGMSELKESFPLITETEASELTSLQDMIKTWYYNGEPCSSTHVLNVLLIGEDTRGSDILENDTRADSAIIASINIDTQEITLTSILRDAYAYWENTEGDESSGVFEKINGAMSIGDVHTYIRAVEKLYKINIDNYVIVNFDSFEKIVDQIGGVTLELTSAEINEINNHQKRYGDVYIEQTFDGGSGEIQLNGEQALAYCRIRQLDSDNARADRQKTCLKKIFEKVKDGSKVTLLKVVNSMIPYVKTGFSTNEIVSIAKYALSQGWLTYDVNMTSVPYNRINEDGMGGTYYGAWVWRPDYPADSYYLQTLIYGKSSITLAQERVDVIGCRDYGFYSETLTPCYATIHNDAYGEVTTYEFQNKEPDPTSSTE